MAMTNRLPEIGDIWVYKAYGGELIYFLVTGMKHIQNSGELVLLLPICDTTKGRHWSRNGLTNDGRQLMSNSRSWRLAA